MILIFFLIGLLSFEINDFFRQKLFFLTHTLNSDTISMLSLESLKDLRQLSLSLGWLIYAIILMGLGIRKRTKRYRMIAILFFGITVLKIFIYDLAFLETLYRIFSFIGLGVILLFVSYLYQRYRENIFA